MTSPENLRFGVGSVLELAESDYMYGGGTLALRVTHADVDPDRYRGMEWVNVKGVEIYPGGTAGEVRYVTVRVVAIRSALRPSGWLPPEYATRVTGGVRGWHVGSP